MADTIQSIFRDVKNGKLSREDARNRAALLDKSELTKKKFYLARDAVSLGFATAAFIIDPTKLSGVGFAAATASFESSASAASNSTGNVNTKAVNIRMHHNSTLTRFLWAEAATPVRPE